MRKTLIYLFNALNSAHDKIQLKMNTDENMHLSIAGINMNTLSTAVINKRQHNPSVDVSTLPKGIYYISVKKEENLYSNIFLKQ